MAKKIECPNCGAPAATPDSRGATECVYCGTALIVEGEAGAQRVGNPDLDRLVQIAASVQGDEKIRQAYLARLGQLRDHLASSSHESLPCPPKAAFWRSDNLKLAVSVGSYVLLGALIKLYSELNMDPDRLQLVGVVGVVVFSVPSFWFALRQKKLEALSWEYWPPVPREGWLERAVTLATEVREMGTHLGLSTPWPKDVPLTVAEAREKTQSIRNAAKAKSETAPALFL